MRILLDTNIILDSLLARMPFFEDADRLFQGIRSGQIIGYVTATTLTDIFYIVKKQRNSQIGKQYVSDLLLTLEICAVNQDILKAALALNLDDFEDAVQLACAMNENLDAIITRDLQGFINSPIAILSPGEVLASLP